MKKVLVWGTGDTAKKFLERFDFDNNQILAFIDNDRKKEGTFFPLKKYGQEDVEIISADSLQDKYVYDMIVICSVYEDEIFAQCSELKVQGEVFGYSDISKVKNIYKENCWIDVICEKLDVNTRINNELVWKAVFSDTVEGYCWWKKTALSLGRWAIGYNYAYVMSRVLNDLKPKSILELGLGQSSKIINNYAMHYNDVNYEVVEHEKDWINFFSLEHDCSKMSIYQLDLVREQGADVEYRYDNIGSVVEGKKYNFISIDAPFGSEKLSRVDILPYITEILDEDFAIMIDDFDRIGEKNMVAKMTRILREANINFYAKKYSGAKDIYIIVSEKWKFLTTL